MGISSTAIINFQRALFEVEDIEAFLWELCWDSQLLPLYGLMGKWRGVAGNYGGTIHTLTNDFEIEREKLYINGRR